MNKKTVKKIIITFGAALVIVAGVISFAGRNRYVAVHAHSTQLDIEYDNCSPTPYTNQYYIGDGEEEKWYELIRNGETRHIPHSNDVTEIKYYFAETSIDGLTSWSDITDSARREYVKSSFANSIKKWNQIRFYKLSSNNYVTKFKLVNISEGTETNHNLTICPDNNIGAIASCGPLSSAILIDNINGVNHKHYLDWCISLKISNHYSYSSTSEFILNRTGAHEFGHIMGLRDIDGCENSSSQDYHHEEILMGYAKDNDILSRQAEITYKDLIGAAITRGLHTDQDHSWIYDYASSSEGNRKLICSICNGVKYVDSLVDYTYVTYKGCNNLHNLSNGNMFPVASYGNKDYYKCKYCRYVAPFTSLVNQDYLVTGHYNSTHHVVTNQVNGLSYSCLEEHTFDNNGICTGCNQTTPHSFNDHYVYYTSNTHKAYCACGEYVLKVHAIDAGTIYSFHGHQYGRCLDCQAIIDLGGNGPIIPVIPFNSNQMVTDNGSYILPNGIYVIVEEDLEAYLNGTLVFHLIDEISE